MLIFILFLLSTALAARNITEICINGSEHVGLPLIPRKFDQQPRIIEGFLFNDEIDMLEIHLNELKYVVDYFIIIESSKTFTGNSKRLVFQDSQNRFLDIMDKIVHVVIHDLPTGDAWTKERFLRNSLYQSDYIRDGDIFIVSDVDEIIRPSVLQYLKYCSGYNSSYLMFHVDLFYYSYNNRLTTRYWWNHPDAVIVSKETAAIPLDDLRAHKRPDALAIMNSGWHCSSCFPSLKMMRDKLHSFSHTNLDVPQFREKGHIVNVVRKGLDWFDRKSQIFEHVDPVDIPQYLHMHMDRFSYMLERRGPTAGFNDYYA